MPEDVFEVDLVLVEFGECPALFDGEMEQGGAEVVVVLGGQGEERLAVGVLLDDARPAPLRERLGHGGGRRLHAEADALATGEARLQVLGRAVGDDLAFVNDQHPVAGGLHFGQDVG